MDVQAAGLLPLERNLIRSPAPRDFPDQDAADRIRLGVAIRDPVAIGGLGSLASGAGEESEEQGKWGGNRGRIDCQEHGETSVGNDAGRRRIPP
jgi:hypothetical protein